MLEKSKEKSVFKKLIFIGSIAFILLFPMFWAFLGVDTADTSSYLYWYSNPTSEYASLFTYLSLIVGSSWLSLFPSLGLFGLNFLEVLVIWSASYLTYITFKETLGKTTVIFGIALSVGIATTYVKIFNFHQFNMLLQVFVVLFILNGIKGKQINFLYAGISIGVMPFVRIASILGLCYLPVIYLYSYWMKKSKKVAFKNFSYACLGVLLGILASLLIIFFAGFGSKLFSEINRLFTLGKAKNESLYSFRDLIKYFVIDVAFTIVIAYVLFRFLLFYAHFKNLAKDKSEKIYRFYNLISFIILFIFLGAFYLLTYKIGIFPRGWAQLTGYSWMLHGILMLLASYYILKPVFENTEENLYFSLIGVLGVASLWMSFVGSAVRLRHVVIGCWVLLPLFVYFVKQIYSGQMINLELFGSNYEFEKANKNFARAIMIPVLIISIIQMTTVNMYDSPYVLGLRYRIQHPYFRFVRTTARGGLAIDKVTEFIDSIKKEDQKLMVFGNSVVLYTTTDMQSYVYPWVTVSSYLPSKFKSDLEEKELSGERLPIIVVNRTNAYYGFKKEDHGKLVKYESETNHNGKRQILENFLNKNKYNLAFIGDYFLVYVPERD